MAPIFSRIFGRRNLPEHLVDDIYRINMQVNYSYLIKNDDVSILIDTGIRDDKNKRTLSTLEKVDYLILTHGHLDHIGNAQFVKEMYNAKIAMHEEDLHYIFPNRDLVPKMVKYFYEFEPFEVDIYLKGGETFPGDIEIIHFPGHTKGTILILAKAGKYRRLNVLFGGDILVEEKKIGLTLPYPKFSEDPEGLYNGILKNLLKINFDVMFLSHASRPFSRKEIIKFLNIVRNYEE